MARAGEKAAATQNSTMTANQGTAFQGAQGDIGKFNTDLDTLKAGGNIAPNPYLNEDYLRNQNLATSAATSGINDQNKATLKDAVARTGSNSASLGYTLKSMNRDRMRSDADQSASRRAMDYDKNLAYQQMILGNDLSPAQIQSGLYGTSVGGNSSAINSQVSADNARYGMWGNIISAAAQGAGAGAAGAACWIAEAIYGPGMQTDILRYWLNNVWAARSRVGRAVMALYRRYGVAVASLVRRYRFVRAIFSPIFAAALKRAQFELGK